MSLFEDAAAHAANPPETWTVAKLGTDRHWLLRTSAGVTLDTFSTRRAAEAARTSGWLVDLYEKERRWYAGEPIRGWKPYQAPPSQWQEAASAINGAARFHPQTDEDTRPALEIAGVLVFAYIDHRTGALRVTIDTSEGQVEHDAGGSPRVVICVNEGPVHVNHPAHCTDCGGSMTAPHGPGCHIPPTGIRHGWR